MVSSIPAPNNTILGESAWKSNPPHDTQRTVGWVLKFAVRCSLRPARARSVRKIGPAISPEPAPFAVNRRLSCQNGC